MWGQSGLSGPGGQSGVWPCPAPGGGPGPGPGGWPSPSPGGGPGPGPGGWPSPSPGGGPGPGGQSGGWPSPSPGGAAGPGPGGWPSPAPGGAAGPGPGGWPCPAPGGGPGPGPGGWPSPAPGGAAGPGPGGWPSPAPGGAAGPGPGGWPSPASGHSANTNLRVPYSVPLPNGVYDKLLITIYGTINRNADKFAVDLNQGKNIAFHFNPRFNENNKSVIVSNSFIGGRWGKEEREQCRFPFVRGQQFEMKILCTPCEFKVAVNGCHLTAYKHRIPNLRSIDQFSIHKDITLSNVKMETLP